MIEWNSNFSVGDTELDRQHKQWFALFNKAHEIMMEGNYQELSELARESVNEMVEYGRMHFDYEEALMRRISYPDYQRHKELHRKFAQQIDQLVLELHRGDHILNSELLKIIETWLNNHILVEDLKIRASE